MFGLTLNVIQFLVIVDITTDEEYNIDIEYTIDKSYSIDIE